MRHKLLLHLLLFLIPASLCGQEVEFEILKPYDRVYYNSNIPSVEVMAYAGRYFNSHGELECIIKDGDKIIYRFSQNFMAAMNDSAKLSFAFNLDPGFYKVELRKEGKLINECVIGYEPELIEKKGVVEEPGSGFENYWRGKIEELSTYPKLTEVYKVKELSKGGKNIYRVSIHSFGGKTLEGYYAVPKQKGLYKAVVKAYALSDTLDLEDLERYAASDTLSDRICFTAQTEESVDIVRFVDFLQEEDAVSLSNIFVEGYGKAGAYALVAAAIDNRISAVAVYAPGCPDYTGADTPQYSNLWMAASKLKTPLLFGVDINGRVADPYTDFSVYNRVRCDKSYYIFLENGEPQMWERLKRNFFDKYTTHLLY